MLTSVVPEVPFQFALKRLLKFIYEFLFLVFLSLFNFQGPVAAVLDSFSSLPHSCEFVKGFFRNFCFLSKFPYFPFFTAAFSTA